MGEVGTIGLDLAKSVFQVHSADASGAVVFRKKLRREQVLPFSARQPRCLVAMEACGGGHYWAREIARLGHQTRLIPPSYVKPFLKRQKNDAADAEAICEAVQRPTIRFVQPKSAEAQGAPTVPGLVISLQHRKGGFRARQAEPARPRIARARRGARPGLPTRLQPLQ